MVRPRDWLRQQERVRTDVGKLRGSQVLKERSLTSSSDITRIPIGAAGRYALPLPGRPVVPATGRLFYSFVSGIPEFIGKCFVAALELHGSSKTLCSLLATGLTKRQCNSPASITGRLRGRDKRLLNRHMVTVVLTARQRLLDNT